MIKNLLLIGGVSIALLSCIPGQMSVFESSEVPMYVSSGEFTKLYTWTNVGFREFRSPYVRQFRRISFTNYRNDQGRIKVQAW